MIVKKGVVACCCLFIWQVVYCQNINFGNSTTFTIGGQTSFFAGGNTTFNGTLTNNGLIISNRDLDFVNNQIVGNLRFVGPTDQRITALNTLTVTNFELNKQGKLVLLTPQILVSGNMNLLSGVVQSDDITGLLVTGQSDNTGEGFVEGRLLGLTAGGPVTFPMGINGFKNYITFTNTTSGIVLLVDCRLPDPDSLLTTEEMVGIADEVEWAVRTVEGVIEASITVDFSGLDLVNFSNGQSIVANEYEPAIVVIQKGDTIHQALISTEASPRNSSTAATEGRVVSSSTVTIDTTVTRISVAWLPVVDQPYFFVPNAFSPNGTLEENRLFRPFFSGGEVTSVSIAVYNAYNKQIYAYAESGAELDLSLIGWDGNLSGGQQSEAGVYYYTIQVIADAQVYKETGSVLLVK